MRREKGELQGVVARLWTDDLEDFYVEMRQQMEEMVHMLTENMIRMNQWRINTWRTLVRTLLSRSIGTRKIRLLMLHPIMLLQLHCLIPI